MIPFPDCPFCRGRGCIACPGEWDKHLAKGPQPIFSANPDDPHDMELLNRVVGREAIDKAFSPGGGGIAAIEREAAICSLIQFLHKNTTVEGESDATPTTR